MSKRMKYELMVSFGILILLLGFVMFKSDKRTDSFLTEVDVLEDKNDKLNKEVESYESKVSELSKKVSELESTNEQMSVKNNELESIISENGIKKTLKEDEKVVFMTFDDGPSELTPEFLKVLDSYGVNATFFVTLQPQYEDTYKRIADEGNAIQIHTATHEYNDIYASIDNYMADFNKAYDYVSSVIGKKPTYFRFPGGSTNSYGKSVVRDIARTMKDKGFDFVDWNVSVGDGSASATKDSIIQKITAESEGKQHIVMLAHDSETKKETLAALPQIIEYYKNNGYDFRTIEDNIDMSFAQFIDY